MEHVTIEGVEYKVLRLEASHRGGGIEISLDPIAEGEKMAAYQNYLGGGMLGSIGVNDTLRRPNRPWLGEHVNQLLDEVAEGLKRAFHNITNHEDDEWESATFEENQRHPQSAY